MSSELGVAVWGLGRHAHRRLLPALVRSEGVKLVGVCSRNEERGKARAAELDCKYFASPFEMLSDDRVHVVFVATPTALHFQHGAEVIAAGKHLWCEKPLTHSYQTTRDLFDRASDHGVSVAAGLMYKYHRQFVTLKRMLAEGVLGEIRSVTIKFGMPQLNVKTFRDDPALGGGALLDLGCYPLSVSYQLLRAAPKLRCARVTTQPSHSVDTDGWAVLEGQGVVVSCEWGMGRAYQNRLEVWGTEGTVVCDRAFTKEDDYDSTLVFHDQRGNATSVVRAGRENSYRVMIETLSANLNDLGFADAERNEALWCAATTDEIAAAASP